MKAMLYVSVIIALLSSQGLQKQPEPVESDYGSAVVSSILQVDRHGRIFCNIEGYPAVIGRNMPVQIDGLKPASNQQDNLPMLRFLNELLLSEKDQPQTITLQHVKRGSAFCLVADVVVDEQDLCDLMIEKGLVKRVIEVPTKASPNSPVRITPSSSGTRGTPPSTTPAGAIVASKTSKVYHRSTCMHAKRMDLSKAVTFGNAAEAEKTGRRPCKICKP